MPHLPKLFKRSSRYTSSSVSHPPPSTAATGWPQGLDIVHEDSDVILDIVAIHGLNGHREKTWTADNDVYWLRDLLPKDLPGVRVLTWGYDANTHARDQVSKEDLYGHAVNLLGDLTRTRTLTKSTERPIIFVAHSLGGIVLKNALINSHLARSNAQDEYRSVKTSTYGIIFMGTPHQGGNGVQLGRALVNIASIFVPADDRILKNLKRDSEALQHQLDQYRHFSDEFVTKFAYELYETRTKLGHSIEVVPRASAVVPGQANTEAMSIPSDHIDMVKFRTKDDAGYKKISESLKIMAGRAEETIRSRWEAEARVDSDEVAPRNNTSSFSLPPNLSRATIVTHFVAREKEIQQMHEILGMAGWRRTAILHGLGGMGKTQLTIEYITRHETQFSAVLWLNAKDTASLRQSFLEAAKRIHRRHPSITYIGNAVQSRDLEECVEAVKQWLDEPANNGWIVVYDNYDNHIFGATKPATSMESSKDNERNETAPQNDDLAQQAFDIRPFLPGTYHGAVIITTRSSEVKLGKLIELKKLTDMDSLEILASTSGRDNISQDEDAKRLARRLDGLPLALATAGAYLEGISTSFADYLELYETSWLELQESSPQITSYEDRALYSTWNISFDHIKKQNPASATLLRLWAYFDNEDLWYELLREGLEYNMIFDPKGYLKGLVDNKINFDRAIRVLRNHGLIEPYSSTAVWKGESPGYSMHACVHSWTRHVLNEDRYGESAYMAQLALTCIALHIPYGLTERHWLTERRLLKHADQCLMRTKSGMQLDDEDMAYLYTCLGVLYEGQRRPVDAEIMYKRAIPIAGKMGLKDLSFHTLINLGNVYRDVGRLAEAEAILKQLLQESEGARGPEHETTVIAVSNLACVYSEQGRLIEAEQMLNRALRGYEKVHGSEHEFTLGTLHNLGILYCQKHRFAKAEAMFNQALQGYEKTLGIEMANTHPYALHALHGLGIISRKLGDKQKSRTHLLRARDGFKTIYGDKSPDYLRTTSELQKLELSLP